MSLLEAPSDTFTLGRRRRNHLRVVPQAEARPAGALTYVSDGSGPVSVTSPVTGGPVVVTKQELFHHALNAVAELRAFSADTEISLETATAALFLVRHLLDDDSATPQVSASIEGGIMVEWRVKGRSLNVQVLSDADIYVWAEDENDVELFQYELTSKWSSADEPVLAMRTFLTTLSQDVSNRVPIKR